MKVDIWSDVVCPFCYIGKRKFENALSAFEGNTETEVVWHSFQLDPEMEQVPGQSIHQYLAMRKGISAEKAKEMNDYMTGVAKEVGLEYNFDKAVINNTHDAHRLLHLALEHGLQNQLKERLFAAYYTEGKDIGDATTLVNEGVAVGLQATEIRQMLAGERFSAEVEADQVLAQQMGANGVPFFVFNNKYAVSGAQPTEVFTQVLEKVWSEEKPQNIGSDTAAFCTTDGECN